MRIKGIAFKTFIFTVGLLIITAMLIYTAIYFIMPEFYYSSKKTEVQKSADALVKELNGKKIDEISLFLNQYVLKSNIGVMVVDKNDVPVYVPPTMIITSSGNNNIPVPQTPVKTEIKINDKSPRSFTGLLEIRREIKVSGEVHKLIVTSPLQPISDAANVILKMLPYILAGVIMIAAIGAWIYSRIITRPILYISGVADKMSRMEDATYVDYNTKDELGQLSNNLNTLYMNLSEAIKDLKKSNELLNIEMNHVKEMERQKSDFMAAVSHELKTPVTAVSGILEGMLDNIGVYKNRDKYLRECRKLMGSFAGLINEVLELSRLERNEFQLQIENLNLKKILNETLEPYLHMAQVRDVRLNSEGPFDYMVSTDKKLLKKALSNVLSNAIKFTPSGKKVRIYTAWQNELLYLNIDNEGENIDESKIKDLFEPFFRVDSSRNRSTGGSGLGLYIVKRNLELCGIKYQLINIQGGVRFSFIFNQE